MDDPTGFASAVARAKQIAAQLTSNSGDGDSCGGSTPDCVSPVSGGGSGSLKRHSDDSEQLLSNPSKRITTDTDKLAAAAAVAAQINQKLGTASGPPRIPTANAPQHTAKITENLSIPEKYVGLMIGKGGEQISRLQEVSGAKIQIAPDSEGTTVRAVSITGTPEQVQVARRMVDEVAQKADRTTTQFDPGSLPRGQTFMEMKIPGMKAGLVIGKGGETIKALQEQCGVKMVMIQESNTPTNSDKPLRITGSEEGVARACKMVNELMSSKDSYPVNHSGQGSWGNQNGGYASRNDKNPNAERTTYAVPAERAGLVIGKGGETVKEICRISNAHVEIQKNAPPNPNIKIFNISGTQSEIDRAIYLICEKAGLPMPSGTSSVGMSGGYSGGSSSSQYGGQYGQPSWEQNASNNVYGGQGGSWNASGAGGASAADSATMPPPTTNPVTGQVDYSAAWAEYYRRQGMHDYADAILAQARGVQSNSSSSAAAAAGQQQAVVQQQAVSGGNQEQWNQQWQQQWQQWQQQWAQQGGQGASAQHPNNGSTWSTGSQ